MKKLCDGFYANVDGSVSYLYWNCAERNNSMAVESTVKFSGTPRIKLPESYGIYLTLIDSETNAVPTFFVEPERRDHWRDIIDPNGPPTGHSRSVQKKCSIDRVHVDGKYLHVNTYSQALVLDITTISTLGTFMNRIDVSSEGRRYILGHEEERTMSPSAMEDLANLRRRVQFTLQDGSVLDLDFLDGRQVDSLVMQLQKPISTTEEE